MAGLVNTLAHELAALATEARRRHPEVKEAAERVQVQLQAYKRLPAANVATALSENHDILGPILLACHARQPRLATIAVNCLQQLIMHTAAPSNAIGTVVKTLSDVAPLGVDVQLRTLQIVLPLLANYPSVHDEELVETLMLCHQLQESTAPMVNSIATATFRQLISAVFDKVTKEDETMQENGNDAFQLLKDLCALTNGDHGTFLRLDGIACATGLELIESILTEHEHIFRKHVEFAELIREQLCPLIIRHFSDRQDFPKTMRLMRVVDVLVRQYHDLMATECEIYLSMVLKLLEPGQSQAWQRILALELVRNICGDFNLLQAIYCSYSRESTSGGIYHTMLSVLDHVAVETPRVFREMIGDADTMLLPTSIVEEGDDGAILDAHCHPKMSWCLDKTEPPLVSERYQYYLAFRCIVKLTDAFAGFTRQTFAVTSRALTAESGSAEETARTTVRSITRADAQMVLATEDQPLRKRLDTTLAMADVAWPGLLASLSAYLTTPLDDEMYRLLMKAFRQFTIIIGVLGLKTPRDAFLTSLCKNAIPAQLSEEPTRILFSERHAACMQALVDVCRYLAELLDADTWYSVLVTFEYADHLLHGRGGGRRKPKHAPTGSSIRPVRRMSGLSTSSSRADVDVGVLLADIQMLFEDAGELADIPFENLVRGLRQLSAESGGAPLVAGSSAADDAAEKASVYSERTRTEDYAASPLAARIHAANKNNEPSFAVDRLRVVALHGMPRLLAVDDALLWQLTVEYLIDTSVGATTPWRVREQACDAVADLISSAMTTAETLRLQESEEIQLRLLTSLRRLVVDQMTTSDEATVSALTDVRRVGLETLDKLLQTSGQCFSYGWSMIFEMLIGVCAESPSAPVSAPHSIGRTGHHGLATTTLTRSTSASSTMLSTGSDGNASPQPSPTRAGSTSGAAFAPSLVRVGFSCLRLICSDFFSVLTPPCLCQCIEALGAYGQQTEDLNISLTAIGQLWNMADFLQTRRHEFTSAQGTEAAAADDTEADEAYSAVAAAATELATKLGGDGDAEALSMARASLIGEAIEDPSTMVSLLALWLLVLLELENLASDMRPEVRNSAVQTLFRTVSLNGAALDATAWSRCVHLVLFPTTTSVMTAYDAALAQAHETASTANSHAGQSGRSTASAARARDVDAWSLHSRISPERQWDETKTLLVQGMTQVFTGYLHENGRMPGAPDAWRRWLSMLSTLCLSSTRTVVATAVEALRQIVTLPSDTDGAEASPTAVPWLDVWSLWVRVGRGMGNAGSEASLRGV
ncbi:guanine nucleotide exchange factor in Golgi transport N-terminal-domain-containing protein, partial [Thamnocephalis sphaerospora]